MTFGQRLRSAREKAGLTQAAFAARWKVAKRTVEHWEKDERLPPSERDAITRERLLASLKDAAAPGPSKTPRYATARSDVGMSDWLGL